MQDAPAAAAPTPTTAGQGGGGSGGGAPDAGRLVLLFGLCALASGTTLRSLDPLLLQVGREFAAPVERVALLATAFALPYALIQPVLGPVGDALGKRRVMLGCTAALALALVVSAMSHNLALLFVTRMLAGAAAGGIIPLGLAGVGDAVPMAQRQVALSRLIMFSLAGQIGGGLFAGAVSGWLGWRGVTLACAAVAVVGALMLAAEARRRPEPPGEALALDRAVARYRGIVANPAARRLFVGVAIEGLLVFGLFPYVAAILEARGLGGAAEAGLVLGCFGLGGLTFTILAPWLLRWLGQARMMRAGGGLALCGYAAVAAVGVPPAPVPGGAAMMAAAALGIGLGFMMLHNSIQTRVTEVAPGARASAVSLHAFSFFLGQAAAPVSFGLVWWALGLEGALLFAGAGTLLLSLWLAARR